ncbi:MAG: SPOR domain-containing protein [Gammaproteobacteria bacterium]|nr:SPOR domain-containing protein [Gammaproteobacteria bacterium]
MATKHTNRIVGALALLAVAVIVLPELLTGKPKPVLESGDEIPLAPEMAVVGDAELAAARGELAAAQQVLPADTSRMAVDDLLAMPLQEGLTGTAADATAIPAVATAEVKVETAAPSPATVPAKAEDPKPLPGHSDAAYSIQLGVFSNATNVAALVGKLRSNGFKVYTSPATPISGKPTRVLVGPNTQKAALESYIPRLRELTGLDGRIVTYDPLAP